MQALFHMFHKDVSFENKRLLTSSTALNSFRRTGDPVAHCVARCVAKMCCIYVQRPVHENVESFGFSTWSPCRIAHCNRHNAHARSHKQRPHVVAIAFTLVLNKKCPSDATLQIMPELPRTG